SRGHHRETHASLQRGAITRDLRLHGACDLAPWTTGSSSRRACAANCCGPRASENHESAAIYSGSLSSESLPFMPKHFVRLDMKRDNLAYQITSFRSGTRTGTAMHVVAANPRFGDPSDVTALAEYLSALDMNPKPVVGSGENLRLGQEIYA